MKRALCILIILVLCLSLFAWTEEKSNDNSNSESSQPTKEAITPARIDILKIGKADCIVINTGNSIVMIDTGEEENLSQIQGFMKKRGYEKIDVLIITHYDKDHIGTAKEIISEYEVGTVLESSFTKSSQLYYGYHNMGKEITKLEENYIFTKDSCKFEINVPKKKKYYINEDNNASLAVSMEIGEKRLLFCGDAVELRVSELIADELGHFDFVKLPHHGRYLENYRDFLGSVTPSLCAITCSEKNPLDSDTEQILAEFGISAYQTRYGSIKITTDGKEIKIKQ